MLSLAAVFAVLTGAQTHRVPRKVPGTAKPKCAKGSICFSGEIREGDEFRKHLTDSLDFVLDLPGGL